MRQATFLLTIIGMGAVTFLPRVIPVLLLTSRRLPPLLEVWLQYLPVAVLAALVLPSLLQNGGDRATDPNSLYAWASLATLIVAWKTRSLLGAVAVGVGTVALARLVTTIF